MKSGHFPVAILAWMEASPVTRLCILVGKVPKSRRSETGKHTANPCAYIVSAPVRLLACGFSGTQSARVHGALDHQIYSNGAAILKGFVLWA